MDELMEEDECEVMGYTVKVWPNDASCSSLTVCATRSSKIYLENVSTQDIVDVRKMVKQGKSLK